MKVIVEGQHVLQPSLRGASFYTCNLIKALLQRQKYEYALTVFDENRERNNLEKLRSRLDLTDIPIYECKDISYKTSLNYEETYINKTYNEYTGANGDVFHFTSLRTIPDNLLGKMVVTVHDMRPFLLPPNRFDRNLRKQFDIALKRLKKQNPLIITDSNFSKNDIISLLNVSPDTVHVIYNAYDKESLYPEKNQMMVVKYGINEPYLLYLGPIDLFKGIDNILKAFSYIAMKFSEIKLVIAGSLEHAQFDIQPHIKQHPFSSRIITTGLVTEEQRRILMSNALVFLFPSLYEGFGAPPLEALACGCPVIASNTTSLPEVVGDAGILVDPTNTEQLAYEIERVIHSDSLRAELCKKGLERANLFSWDKTAEMTENVYALADNYNY